ncbi:hypothetical protein [Cyanobium sp. Morenito 9A2]|uniref:hypothetical protein n=1 Tax=Cyanobium sp. Morenito 9A2 TaxID=2823718 RepID=UPI0020CD11F3|nr:hypothetical protein [Cyanobium sp. Morenito 9A2]
MVARYQHLIEQERNLTPLIGNASLKTPTVWAGQLAQDQRVQEIVVHEVGKRPAAQSVTAQQ